MGLGQVAYYGVGCNDDQRTTTWAISSLIRARGVGVYRAFSPRFGAALLPGDFLRDFQYDNYALVEQIAVYDGGQIGNECATAGVAARDLYLDLSGVRFLGARRCCVHDVIIDSPLIVRRPVLCLYVNEYLFPDGMYLNHDERVNECAFAIRRPSLTSVANEGLAVRFQASSAPSACEDVAVVRETRV